MFETEFIEKIFSQQLMQLPIEEEQKWKKY
jgi:hypothetical protein